MKMQDRVQLLRDTIELNWRLIARLSGALDGVSQELDNLGSNSLDDWLEVNSLIFDNLDDILRCIDLRVGMPAADLQSEMDAVNDRLADFWDWLEQD